jgi:hypothetical protein
MGLQNCTYMGLQNYTIQGSWYQCIWIWVGLRNLDIQQIKLVDQFWEAGVEDSSFKKAQETLHYVAKDTAGISSLHF